MAAHVHVGDGHVAVIGNGGDEVEVVLWRIERAGSSETRDEAVGGHRCDDARPWRKIDRESEVGGIL